METPDANAEREIFAAAAALPLEERAAYLDVSCDGRPTVRANVEAWLGAHEPSDFMNAAEDEPRRQPEAAGERIGNYKLLEKIGEGGFGTVWVADQERPVRRRVALKIIKLGMDTKEVIARFGQERQALAMMEHPHIAKVLDAGATEWGRPYFVMELVRGIKITDYCDHANLPTVERLALFIQVCQAVQHAHQKGIIHRDLKPSNILVTLHDGVPVAKVIDFGVAKATQQQRLSDLTIYTQFQQMVGTPLYMSPEQAEMNGLDIDTRSDIYSLGVLLYELLTGRTPFDPGELMRQGLDEIRRVIREREPQTPSTFLRTMADATRASVAQHRQSDPDRLMKLVRGDLDWIVMKALEKDRSRRYDTANGLAMDIQRHLANEPVLARPPTAIYRFRRLVRRNRGVFAAAGAVVAALVIGLGMATRSFLNERRALAGETKQREIAEERNRQAVASELKARQFLYAADINLAQQALSTSNTGRTRQLLDRHRPADGRDDLRGWEWRYLWQQCRSGAQARLGNRDGGGFILSTSFSPDAGWLAVSYFDGRVELWDVAKREISKVLQRPFKVWAHAAFSPRADVLAATMGPKVVKSYQVKTGTETTLCAVDGWVCDLSYSADGEWLAVLTCDPGSVQVVQAADGRPVLKYPLPSGGGQNYNNVRFSPNKQRLYISSNAWHRPDLRCVSVPNARLLWQVPIGRIDESDAASGTDIGFSAMDLSPDGRTLAVASGPGDRAIRMLDATTGRLVKKLEGHTGWITGLAFSHDGRVLASSSSDQTVRRWNTANWTELATPLRGHCDQVHTVVFSGDDRYLATASKDGEILLWDTTAPPPRNGQIDLPPRIQTAIGLPGSRHLLAKSLNGSWSLIDLLTLAEEPLPLSEAPAPKYAQNWFINMSGRSPDGTLRAEPDEGGSVGLYEAATGSKIGAIRSNMGWVEAVAFSPDNRRLVLAGHGNQTIELWDMTTRQVLLTLPRRGGSVLSSLEFTEDGNTLVSGTYGGGRDGVGACRFWSVPSWAEIEEAERAGGRWQQTDPSLPPPAPSLPEEKNLLERVYRTKLGEARARLPAFSARRDYPLESLADLLVAQGRLAEAIPLFRELHENRRRRPHPSEPSIIGAASSLATILIRLAQQERMSGDFDPMAEHIRQADALIADQLPLLARNRSVQDPWSLNWILDGLTTLTRELNDLAEFERAAGNLEEMEAAARRVDQLMPYMLPLMAQKTVYDSTDRDHILKAAALQAWFGREADQVAIARLLLQQAEDKPDHTGLAQCAAKALCLRPSSDPVLLARVLPIARRAVGLATQSWQRACYQQTEGIAEYRAGNFAAAEQLLMLASEGERKGPRESWPLVQCPTRLFRAMILFRQGKEAEARKLFAEAEALMKPLPAADRLVLQNGITANDLIVWLAYKEARLLLGLEK